MASGRSTPMLSGVIYGASAVCSSILSSNMRTSMAAADLGQGHSSGWPEPRSEDKRMQSHCLQVARHTSFCQQDSDLNAAELMLAMRQIRYINTKPFYLQGHLFLCPAVSLNTETSIFPVKWSQITSTPARDKTLILTQIPVHGLGALYPDAFWGDLWRQCNLGQGHSSGWPEPRSEDKRMQSHCLQVARHTSFCQQDSDLNAAELMLAMRQIRYINTKPFYLQGHLFLCPAVSLNTETSIFPVKWSQITSTPARDKTLILTQIPVHGLGALYPDAFWGDLWRQCNLGQGHSSGWPEPRSEDKRMQSHCLQVARHTSFCQQDSDLNAAELMLAMRQIRYIRLLCWTSN
ncbi:hypothetical protein DFH06DRAFT_1125328 [Mycena polygramma]|nr:hypothetical protein DFH06DRAFT_1125328 [Mycena polygramma]